MTDTDKRCGTCRYFNAEHFCSYPITCDIPYWARNALSTAEEVSKDGGTDCDAWELEQ